MEEALLGKECEWIPNFNGYLCKTDRFRILEFESIAPDFNKRMLAPVYVTSAEYTNKLNMWM